MRKEYSFTKLKGRKNSFAQRLKKQVTIRLGQDIIDYFKSMALEMDIPYQKLINLYLRECAQSNRKLKWAA
ncbi:MAG: BrnA antitoxin family protein [Candidatus Omnitrophica bacterium]|nr:BrnA antitoxin family protein [Candidatus Omnitrophota bacterium]